MSSTRRRGGRTADQGGSTAVPTSQAGPELPLDDEEVVVGDQVRGTAKPSTRRRRQPFGSYLDPDLQKALKVRCITRGIEIQDALDQAIRMWLEREERSDQPTSQQAN
jgi:hypothetical protein